MWHFRCCSYCVRLVSYLGTLRGLAEACECSDISATWYLQLATQATKPNERIYLVYAAQYLVLAWVWANAASTIEPPSHPTPHLHNNEAPPPVA